MPHEQQMKIQLAKETWYDMLAFVLRHQLGKIVPIIGDRKFASIVQPFLHEYREIKIGYIEVVAPNAKDPDGPGPQVVAWQNDSQWIFKMAETQMPANIKNFDYLELSYFDQSVLTFMQKFQQNGLLDNVHLWFDKLPSMDIFQVLCHLLPLMNGILSIEVAESTKLVDFYDAGNSKEIYEMNMKMMEETRFLGVSCDDDPKNLHASTIDLYCRWLYQTPRADGKPRVLHFRRRDVDSAPISLFIGWLKEDFLMATNPATFFIRIMLTKAFQPLEDICLDNGKTKERLLTKMEKVYPTWDRIVLLISRYPLASTKKWIVENETEVSILAIYKHKEICLTGDLKGIAI